MVVVAVVAYLSRLQNRPTWMRFPRAGEGKDTTHNLVVYITGKLSAEKSGNLNVYPGLLAPSEDVPDPPRVSSLKSYQFGGISLSSSDYGITHRVSIKQAMLFGDDNHPVPQRQQHHSRPRRVS